MSVECSVVSGDKVGELAMNWRDAYTLPKRKGHAGACRQK